MAKKFDRSAFIAVFKQEAEEHLQKLNDDILTIESAGVSPDILDNMLKTTHTLKGSSAMMGFKRISEIAHKLEDIFSFLKEQESEPEREHVDLVLEALDAIRHMLEDKVMWSDKGVEYPFVENLVSKLDTVLKPGMPEKKKTKDESPESVAAKKSKKPRQKEGLVAKETLPLKIQETVRVYVTKLDMLMNLAGEMVICKKRFNKRISDIAGVAADVEKLTDMMNQTSIVEHHVPSELAASLKAVSDYCFRVKENLTGLSEDINDIDQQMNRVTTDLQEQIVKIRMLPLSTLFNTLPRAVRDLSNETGKEIRLEISGADTELDKNVIDEMKTPLMHIMRNAIDHGIEKSEVRKSRGKPAGGLLKLKAYHLGDQVVIEFEDDGEGIDIESVKDKILEKNLVAERDLAQMSENQILQFMFMPGFSTKAEVTSISGRGVGLDVVRDVVTRLKGLIEIDSKAGRGTKFIIKLPLTLAITQAFLVGMGRRIFAITLDKVVETVKLKPQMLREIGGKPAASLRNQLVPLAQLKDVLGLSDEVDQSRYTPCVVIVGLAEKRMGLVVDRFLGKQEIVVKSMGNYLGKVKNIAGATILGSGDVVLIMDVSSIIEEADQVLSTIMVPEFAEGEKEKPLIMVIDDSLITSTLEKNILETAGYRVELAKNGEEALTKLEESSQKFSLIMTDIVMPGMDGFTLTSRIKQQERYKDIPVIICSSRDSEEDVKRGIEVGAEAYFVKGNFETEKLLETVERLV